MSENDRRIIVIGSPGVGAEIARRAITVSGLCELVAVESEMQNRHDSSDRHEFILERVCIDLPDEYEPENEIRRKTIAPTGKGTDRHGASSVRKDQASRSKGGRRGNYFHRGRR
ncbi:MAG: hypothetical protein HGA31_03590 [Candidatus Moranbacteria bacterium]|nr:hypothetical protein [Candidatus Moranbacteria bacterium]